MRWVHLVDGNHARYGGYLVHLGMALVALGVIGTRVAHAGPLGRITPCRTGPSRTHYAGHSPRGTTSIHATRVTVGLGSIGLAMRPHGAREAPVSCGNEYVPPTTPVM